MKRLLISGALSALLLGGCITLPWQATTAERYTATNQNMSLELPADWMRSSSEEVLLVTRDGVLLQYIVVEPIHVDDELTNTKKRFARGMLPFEQAEVLLDNMASSDNRTVFKVHSKKPAKISGHEGFRAEYSYKDSDGLAYRGILYGFMQNDWFYGIHYVATDRHYFPRDLKAFEKTVKSVRLLI